MKDSVKVGIIGLGGRGSSLLEHVILTMRGVEIVAVCDLYEDRAQEGGKIVEKAGRPAPVVTQNYRDILAMPEVDAVVITTSWRDHFKIAIEAMRAGKYVGCEVGGAYSLDQCWELVRTYEETGVPCMMMENCCFGREELMVLRMVREGIFGQVVHCSGGYRHDLREEIAYGKENRHYRLENYLRRNCENYPTHELGPIAKILDINRGNQMLSLVSMSSKAAGLKEYIRTVKGEQDPLASAEFAQGDIVTTMIRCARGETILLTLDTTLPRPYSRGFHVQGTKAMFEEDNLSLYIDSPENQKLHFEWKGQWGNVEQYRDQYEHPVWQSFLKEDDPKVGHGGMDWLEFRAFFDSVKNETEVPVDVYDMAAWSCISVLSEQSIAMGSQPVAIPDFTQGKWITREPQADWTYTTSK